MYREVASEVQRNSRDRRRDRASGIRRGGSIPIGLEFRLYTCRSWHQLFHDLIDDLDETTVKKRQTEALKVAKVPEAS